MKPHRPALILAALLLVNLACNLPIKTSSTPDAALPAAPTTGVSEIIPTPTVKPAGITEIPSTAPEPTAVPTSVPGYLPNGFVSDTHDGIGLTFFNLAGSPITELRTPGWFGGSSEYVHVAGSLPQGPVLVPLVYFTFENAGAIQMNTNDQISTLVSAPSFVSLAGAAGQPVVAYSTAEFDDNGLHDKLYVGSLDSLPGPPVIDLIDPESWAIKPLVVTAANGQPLGVWYTYAAWGIGGDIVFEPRNGLYYLDLASGQSNELLDRNHNPSSLSFDQTWVAYSPVNWDTPQPLSIRNLSTGENYTIPLIPESDRGAGNATFSPDNQYVAWMEGSGYMMAEVPNFYATIRIATTSGAHLADIRDSDLNGIAGSGEVQWVVPAGWLDQSTLILEVRFENWDEAALIRVNYDGAGLAYLAPGSFIGFLYP